MSPRRSKREVTRALEELTDDLSPGQSVMPSGAHTEGQRQAIRELLRYRRYHRTELETTETSVGLTPAAIREIVEHMGDDQQRRIVDLLDNDSTDRFSTAGE